MKVLKKALKLKVKKSFIYSRVLCVFIISLLVGCGGTTDLSTRLDDYLKDLNRLEILSISAPEKRFPQVLLPSHSMKQQVLTQFDIGLIEFLSLQQCDLGLLVGKKNSVLGKVMSDSQRLLYEISVIKALNECEPESSELKQKLSSVSAIKRRELAKAYANAVYNSQEADVFFSVSNGYLPLSENQSGYQSLRISLDVIAQLGRVINSEKSAAFILNSGILVDFESHFKAINDSEYAGKLLLSLIILTDYLNVVADNLTSLTTDPGFCRGPMVFLKQQFKRHYIELIQPYMARVNRTAYEVLASLAVIRLSSAKASTELTAFLNQFSLEDESQIWSLYQVSAKRHAAQWNRLLRACQLF
ncbi:hypothetical protein MED121_07590 [Marinomonas sp. MED121]|nr:hypothetical protein MED121_07590 [Marinomonas sp. MED121]